MGGAGEPRSGERRPPEARGCDGSPGEQDEAFARVACLLKQANRALARSGADLPSRAELTRRLLVIAGAARHDVVSASRRLEAFLGGLPRDVTALLGRESEETARSGRQDDEPTGGRSADAGPAEGGHR